MSKTAQKKLKGIVSISSDNYPYTNSQTNEKSKPTTNNKINNKKDINLSEPSKPITKKKQVSSSSSSTSKSNQLPDNFFEQILICEFKLKEKFDIKTFYDLINLYHSAINYYESINDPRLVTYNQSLNLLFSMPEVKKFLEGKKSLTKTEKKNDLEKRMLQSEKRITKDRVKKIYLSKAQKNFGKNIISEEFNKQSDIFKKRKEEKRKKYLLSTSALPRSKKNNNNNDTSGLEDSDNKNQNKTCDVINQDDDDNDNDKSTDDNLKKLYKTSGKKTNPINITNFGDNNLLDELKIEDLKNEINKIKINNNENDSEKNYLDDTLSFTNSDNLLIDASKFQRLTNKTLFQEKLKSNLDHYMTGFYNIFLDKYLNSIVKDYTESGNNIEKKLIDSSLEFYKQKTQMEYLLNGEENDETYNDQIESMIQQINDEEEEAKMKILKEGEQKVNILNDKYLNSIEIFNTHKMILLKEKLKLDVTKSVNSIVLK